MTDTDGGVEVFFRNPHNYIRELVDAGVAMVAWDRGQLVKSKIDPIKHAELYFGTTFDWRVLAIGIQGTAEYRPGDSWFEPTAVYPTWEYGMDMMLLEDLMANPVGEVREACEDKKVPGDERPVFGQEHRVVITNFPQTQTGPGRQFVQALKTLQEDYPDCILHLHGLYSQRVMYGMGFRSVDVDPRTSASKGKVDLPMGKQLSIEAAVANNLKIITMLGFKPVDLKVPAQRCIFNIKSALWAADNFGKLYAFRTRSDGREVDTTTPDTDYVPPQTKGTGIVSKAKEGDKFHCDTCSLADECKHYRDGAVCSLKNAEPRTLSSYFKTRDAETIVEGLSVVVQANARRLERGMATEAAIGDLDKETTKLMGQVFDQGTKLAKLIDPNLRGGTRVQVNVGAGAQAAVVGTVDPKQVVAQAVRELEARGFTRDQMTPEMIAQIVGAGQNPEQMRRSIEAGQIVDNGHAVIEQ